MTKKDVSQLGIPPDVQSQGGDEVLRAFVTNGGLSVSLQRAFDDPAMWGLLLADLARHAARIYAAEDKRNEADTIAQIRDMFDDELERPTDVGTTSGLN